MGVSGLIVYGEPCQLMAPLFPGRCVVLAFEHPDAVQSLAGIGLCHTESRSLVAQVRNKDTGFWG